MNILEYSKSPQRPSKTVGNLFANTKCYLYDLHVHVVYNKGSTGQLKPELLTRCYIQIYLEAQVNEALLIS